MRILIVVHGFPPHAQGGAEIYAEQHALALVRGYGDDVHVLTREQRPERPEYAIRSERRDGLGITWINNTFRDIRTFEDSYRSAPIARIAADVIDEFRPEAAHVHHLTCLSTEIPGLLAARGVPTLLTLHDYWLLCHRGQLLDTGYRLCAGPEPSGCHSCVGAAWSPLPSTVVPALRAVDRRLPRPVASGVRNLMAHLSDAMGDTQGAAVARRRLEHMQAVCRHVDRVLAPSRSIRDRFISFGIAPERIELSPYGIDHAPFGPRPAALSPSALRVGFLGTLMASKAPHVLLEAFRRLAPGTATVDLLGAQADYHGDASYRDVLAPLLSLPGVRALGPQARPQISGALASLDVLVVPSIWPETSPIVIREAFLTGLPVVGSNIGGIPELVQHELNGLLFEPGDVEGLHRALQRLIDEPGLLERLRGGAARTSVRTLDDDVADIRGMYESSAAKSRSRRERPRLSAIVLNFQTAADTAIAVASLEASDRPADEVIVVDNDASPECRDALARWGGAVTYLPTVTNLGFSGGMNAGIRKALEGGADLVLLDNSDVGVPPDCIGRLERALTADPEAGIAGPLVLSRSAPDVVGSSGIDYNLHTGRIRHRGTGASIANATGVVRSESDANAVSGCFMLVTRKVFDRVGLFDERYFFSFEEIDFCLRARAAGFRTRLDGGARVYHEGGQAIGAGSPRRLYYAARNHLMLAHAHAGADGMLTRGARELFIVALNLAHAIRASGGSLPARLGATLRGIRDYLRGRDGPGLVGGRPI